MVGENAPSDGRAAAAGADRVLRVGLWGAPASGKTTFLASLFLAAKQLTLRNGQHHPMTVTPKNPDSAEFQRRYEADLGDLRRFPDATSKKSELLEWRFTGDLAGTRFGRRRRWLLPTRPELVDFTLRLRDQPGGAFLSRMPIDGQPGSTPDEALIDELGSCDGLIYLFDPYREANDSAYAYFHGVLNRLSEQAGRNGRADERGRLLHRIAVCVTKFDDDQTFGDAELTGFVRRHPTTGQPHIPDHSAEQYFDVVCNTVRGTAQLIRDDIRSSFLPERIRYYAVSSVGFHYNASSRRWAPNVAIEGGRVIIRDRPQPVNVLDAVVNLERAISGAGGA